MLAPRPIETTTTTTVTGPVPADEPRPVRSATDEDAAAVSPVHALHARLADELDPSRPQPGFDPMKLAILAVNIACWWGLISLGMLVARNWPFH